MEKNQIFIKTGTKYKKMTRELLEESNLAELIGDKNKMVGIKPNLVSPSDPANGGTTHPEIVAGILEYLKEKGLKNVRLRLHGDVIRIEVERSAMKTVLEMAEDVVSYIKGLGFCYVTLDLEGFRSGSMDLVLSETQKSQGQAE